MGYVSFREGNSFPKGFACISLVFNSLSHQPEPTPDKQKVTKRHYIYIYKWHVSFKDITPENLNWKLLEKVSFLYIYTLKKKRWLCHCSKSKGHDSLTASSREQGPKCLFRRVAWVAKIEAVGC